MFHNREVYQEFLRLARSAFSLSREVYAVLAKVEVERTRACPAGMLSTKIFWQQWSLLTLQP